MRNNGLQSNYQPAAID